MRDIRVMRMILVGNMVFDSCLVKGEERGVPKRASKLPATCSKYDQPVIKSTMSAKLNQNDKRDY